MMKLVLSACLLIHSVSAFARPFSFWGRNNKGATAAVVAAAASTTTSQTNTCLQATSTATVDSKPTVIDAANWELLSERGQAAVARLIAADEGFGAQAHVYSDWPAAGTDDEGKKRLAEQVSGALVCGVECAGED